jgi:hypothetical protein
MRRSSQEQRTEQRAFLIRFIFRLQVGLGARAKQSRLTSFSVTGSVSRGHNSVGSSSNNNLLEGGRAYRIIDCYVLPSSSSSSSSSSTEIKAVGPAV